MKTTVLTALLALLNATAHAQDPVKTSPQFYKVLLENDQVRVLEYRLKPGEKEPMHSHPAGIVHLLRGAKLKITHPDGKTEERAAAAPGETIWREPTVHALENVGESEARAIAIDLKTAQPAPTSNEEETLWNLERAYWRYVQDNDLSSYANLWHERFLGWPSVSTTPVHKDHITDWITAQTSKGLVFKAGEFKPAAIQVAGDVAMVCYWIAFKWVDQAGHGPAYTLRITHAWLKTGGDWRIIGGMSMPEPEKRQSDK